MKRLIAALAITLCAASAHAQVIGRQQAYNIKLQVCEVAGNAAALNYDMLNNGDGTYELPSTATGRFRKLVEAAEDEGAPYRATSAQSARENGFSYCIDNFEASMVPGWKPSL